MADIEFIDHSDLIDRLQTESDLCRCETATDIADLLDEAVAALSAKGREPDMAGRVWLIWSNEHRAWWRANGQGYTATVADAGRYTLHEGKNICHEAGTMDMYPNATTQIPAEVLVISPEATGALSPAPEQQP